MFGEEGSTNVQGEHVKKVPLSSPLRSVPRSSYRTAYCLCTLLVQLDVISNEAFITALRRSNVVSAMVSEEDDQVIFVPDALGHYVVCFDPLDGSSNIDVNISIGTIFAIYRLEKSAAELKLADLTLPGSHLCASGYCMYGSSTVMVMTTLGAKKVSGFTLDPATGEFVLSHPDIRIPAHKDIYSVNQGNSSKWSADLREYVNNVCCPPTGSSYSLRYVGSMVADVHRTLIYGGIFAYPADAKSKDGKLRLMYEANPMAMIVEHAGGRCIFAKGKRVLDIHPTSIHQRTPIFLGGTKNIEELEKYIN